MLDVKSAVKVATEYLSSLVPAAQQTRLEEVELTEDGAYWLITLSYYAEGGIPFESRSYKLLKVDRQTGDVVAMKIRTLQQ